MACAYCGRDVPLTREHVFPQWLRREISDHPYVAPVRGRHLFGGDLVISDVCADCNNGALSELDEAAKHYWDAGLDSASELFFADRLSFARWATKVSYNSQRAAIALGRSGDEPPMPPALGHWVLHGTGPVPVVMSITRMPTSHRDREGAGSFGNNGSWLPRRYIQLRGSVVLIAWDIPGAQDAAQLVAQYDRTHMPAVDLLATADPLAIPLISDPDVVRRGFWNNPELLRRMAERYPPDEDDDTHPEASPGGGTDSEQEPKGHQSIETVGGGAEPQRRTTGRNAFWRLTETWLAIAALAASITSLCFDCAQHTQVSRLTKVVNAVAYQPILSVQGPPLIDSIGFNLDITGASPSADSVLDIPGSLIIVSTLRLRNDGTTIARVVGTVTADTMSGRARLRQALRKGHPGRSEMSATEWEGFFQPPEVTPKDSTLLHFRHEVQLPEDGYATLHYLVLYRNPLGDMYDTYFWARFRLNEPLWRRVWLRNVTAHDTSYGVGFAIDRSQLLRSAQLVDYQQGYNLYNATETRAFERWIDQQSRRDSVRARHR